MRLGAAAGCLILSSIALSGCSQKAEQILSDETAEQMEAGKKGRNAARQIVTQEWPDTVLLKLAILDARAEGSVYEIEGKTKCKERFDKDFFNTIRTVRPDLAKELGDK